MDRFTRDWITRNAIDICAEYDNGVLTLRGLHYQLVGLGMTNSTQHYKRVGEAMVKARRDRVIRYEQFSDHERDVLGETKVEATDLDESIEIGKQQIKAWMKAHRKNRWENQPRYLEVWIEKKALQGIFGKACEEFDVALCPCKGYPSLTYLNEAAERFLSAEERGQEPTIVYFGDHDPSGEDIPRCIGDSLGRDFEVEVDVQIIALNVRQCRRLKLPAAPVKTGDSRTANFTGLGQIELDAVKPEMLHKWAMTAITKNFDDELYAELLDAEKVERAGYQDALRKYVKGLE